jgi:hypothetical protein
VGVNQAVPAAAVEIELEQVRELLVLNLPIETVGFGHGNETRIKYFLRVGVLDRDGLFESHFLARATGATSELHLNQLKTQAPVSNASQE